MNLCDCPQWLCFLCVCVSAIVWNAPLFVLLCVWLCAQARWLVADNNTRGRVFVDLLAEEIPTVLSVSGLCVFLRLHAWLRQLFYSPVGPLNPTQPLSLADPSFPQRPALHLIRAALAKPSAELLRAPQSCSMLTIHPPSPPRSHHLHVKTLGLISSSLELWHRSQVFVYVWAKVALRESESKWTWTPIWLNLYSYPYWSFISLPFSSREILSETIWTN